MELSETWFNVLISVFPRKTKTKKLWLHVFDFFKVTDLLRGNAIETGIAIVQTIAVNSKLYRLIICRLVNYEALEFGKSQRAVKNREK